MKTEIESFLKEIEDVCDRYGFVVSLTCFKGSSMFTWTFTPNTDNVEYVSPKNWPKLEPSHLQAITFAYEKGFAAGFSGRNTDNVFAETGGQRDAFDIGLDAGRRQSKSKINLTPDNNDL